MKNSYDDIIGLPHPTSLTHPRMSLLNRAAQFAPFAALTGFEEAITETARTTQEKTELSEASQAVIDAHLNEIDSRCAAHDFPWVTITYFCPDHTKEGGMYRTMNACVRRIDPTARKVILKDGMELPIDDLYSVEFLLDTDTVF